MENEAKKQAIMKYIQDRAKWSDQNVMDDFKGSKRLDNDIIEGIQRNAPIDPQDYSDYSTKYSYTPEQQAQIDAVRNKQYERAAQAEAALNERGYEKYKKKGQSNYGVDAFAFKNPSTGKVLRQLGGVLPVAGTLAALASGDVSAAAEELPSEIPGIGQVYDAVRSENAGSSNDDTNIINEVKARQNYDKSPARAAKLDALRKLSGR